MYILECSDGSFYVGSTVNLEARMWQHEEGEGSEYTRHRLPVSLVYCEEFDRVEDAFRREKQVQGWSRRKRVALITEHGEVLPALSKKVRRLGRDNEAPVPVVE
jgi:putative endonuclease